MLVERRPLKNITLTTDKLFVLSITISFTKVSFTAKDNWPIIINMIPIAPVEKIYLRFILKIIFSDYYAKI